MQLSKSIVIALCLLSSNAFAQVDEKGLLFTIGEKIMNLGGYSYLELEKRNNKVEKDLSECLTEVTQVKFQRDKKEEELKQCQGAEQPTTEQPTTEQVNP